MLKTFFVLFSIIFSSALYAQGLDDSNNNIEKVVLEVLDESQGSDNLDDTNMSESNNTLSIPR